MEKAKIALGVLIFPDFSAEFSVADDFRSAGDAAADGRSAGAGRRLSSPDLKRRASRHHGSRFRVERGALSGICPRSGSIFSTASTRISSPITNHHDAGHGTQHLPELSRWSSRQNLGYVAQATLNIPVWNWGATRSKIKQAEQREIRRRPILTLAQKTLQGNVAGAYAEARRRAGATGFAARDRWIWRRRACA